MARYGPQTIEENLQFWLRSEGVLIQRGYGKRPGSLHCVQVPPPHPVGPSWALWSLGETWPNELFVPGHNPFPRGGWVKFMRIVGSLCVAVYKRFWHTGMPVKCSWAWRTWRKLPGGQSKKGDTALAWAGVWERLRFEFKLHPGLPIWKWWSQEMHFH